jgi:hypothetical protein
MGARRSPRLLAAVLLVALALGLAACGSSGSSSTAGNSAGATTTGTVHLAKTKFILHAGLAFGAFHRYIWKPLRAGDFRHPFSHKLTIVKAGLAAAFIDHELKLALKDAQSSPTLSKLVAPITALEARIHGVGSHVQSSSNQSALSQANGSIGAIEGQAASAGQTISEQSPSSF